MDRVRKGKVEGRDEDRLSLGTGAKATTDDPVIVATEKPISA